LAEQMSHFTCFGFPEVYLFVTVCDIYIYIGLYLLHE